MSDAESDYNTEAEEDITDDELEENEEEVEDSENESETEIDGVQVKVSHNRIPDDKRKSSNILTDYEITRVIGTRAQEIESGNSMPYVEYVPGMSFIDIARQELIEKKIPYIIRRPTSTALFEEYKLSDLQILDNF